MNQPSHPFPPGPPPGPGPGYAPGPGYPPGPPAAPGGAPPAGWGRRAAAYLIDSVLAALLYLAVAGVGFGAIYLVVQLVAPESFEGGESPAMLLFLFPPILLGLAAAFCYRWLPHSRSGQTPAKRWLGIKVISCGTGLPPTKGRSFLREVVYIVLAQTCIGIVDVLWPLWDDRRQTLHDKAGDTLVIRV
ncbi:RDD family protein [Nocardiopsis mangrovi]|uniref:RDD family protein n=1 Tax=Nocardiopsis mangrovi TaxID=1179818 RepID=A0ABV9DPJ2_9ACTN